MDLSISIINYNTPELTIQCIQSIKDHIQNLSYEILLSDNNSADDSQALLAKEFKEDINNGNIVFIANTENLGFGRAHNKAIKKAKGEYILILNSDAYLIDNSIELMHKTIRENPQIGSAGCQIYNENDEIEHSFGIFPSITNLVLRTLGLGWITKPFSQISTQYTKNSLSVPFVSGADLMISKQIYEEIEGFDERFFLYYEDTELGYRIKTKGYQNIVLTNAKVKHLGSQSVKSSPNLNLFNIARNSEVLFYGICHGSISAYIGKILLYLIYFRRYVFSGFKKSNKDQLDLISKIDIPSLLRH